MITRENLEQKETQTRPAFVDSEFFKGLCDLYIAQAAGRKVYVTRSNVGILATLMNRLAINSISEDTTLTIVTTPNGSQRFAPNATAKFPVESAIIPDDLENSPYMTRPENLAKLQEYAKSGNAFSVFPIEKPEHNNKLLSVLEGVDLAQFQEKKPTKKTK